jgi:glycosyltransferase involved in cell wall biosynthesis
LPIAVRSALQGMKNEVEVIVVPNGLDDSWKQSMMPFITDKRVHIKPITVAQANIARNHGLLAARGKYVRFLDDDDYLLPAAVKQLEMLENSGAEISSGTIEQINIQDSTISLMPQRDDHDLVCAMARPHRVCLPTAHIFLQSSIRSYSWEESLSWEQDTHWMMQLCAAKEWVWQMVPYTVGRWTTHNNHRTSRTISNAQRAQYTSNLFIATLNRLRERTALTASRSDAFSEALWDYAHLNFFRDPHFWARIAKIAMRLNPERRPPDPFFSSRFGRHISPLIIEYLLAPTRSIKHYRVNRKTNS